MASSSSSPSRNAAVSPPRSSATALSDSCKIAVDDDYSFLVGWWFWVSKDGKDPYGHIIQIREDHGRYLARSYSPWKLATTKMGTSLFELYVTRSEESKDKKQVIPRAVNKSGQHSRIIKLISFRQRLLI